MNIVGVIPARYGAQRLPGKPLRKILGKPLLQWVIEGASNSRALSKLIVATDHPEIAKVAESAGVEAVMTDSNLASGSDRVWAAVKDLDCDVIVNIQGDEPLVKGEIIDALVEPFSAGVIPGMSTLGRKIDEEALFSESTAKIVLNHEGNAVYFSRFPIPYSRVKSEQELAGCLQHIGLYAYRKPVLEKFCKMGPIDIERLEGLEQLRALYLGVDIRVVEVEHRSWGVDTEEDVARIENILRGKSG